MPPYDDEAHLRRFGEVLRSRRISANLSIGKLAIRAGVSTSYLHTLEAARHDDRPVHRPAPDTLRTIARGLAYDAYTHQIDEIKASMIYAEFVTGVGYDIGGLVAPNDPTWRNPGLRRVADVLQTHPEIRAALQQLPERLTPEHVSTLVSVLRLMADGYPKAAPVPVAPSRTRSGGSA